MEDAPDTRKHACRSGNWKIKKKKTKQNILFPFIRVILRTHSTRQFFTFSFKPGTEPSTFFTFEEAFRLKGLTSLTTRK